MFEPQPHLYISHPLVAGACFYCETYGKPEGPLIHIARVTSVVRESSGETITSDGSRARIWNGRMEAL